MQVACVARHSIELDQCKLYLLMPAVAAFLSSFSPKDRINRVGITADDIQQFRFAGCLEVRHSCLDHMPCTVEFVPMPEIRPSLVRLDNGIVRIEVAIRLLCRSESTQSPHREGHLALNQDVLPGYKRTFVGTFICKSSSRKLPVVQIRV